MDTTNKNTDTSSNFSPAPVSFTEAFWYWLKLGFISFGGPAGQISIMHHDLVEKNTGFQKSDSYMRLTTAWYSLALRRNS